MRKIQIVPSSRKEEMRKLLFNYLTELSEFDPDIKFDDNNLPIYRWFDCYWEDKDRFPLYLIIDNTVAGIAMIRELDSLVYDFAEFYVCPEFRKDGNAIWFATEIANLFEGQFVFSTRFTNQRAIKFWTKFANQYNKNEYFDDDLWRNWTIRKLESKTHTLNLNPEYFDLMRKGIKTLEGLLNDDKRKDFRVGDKIIFYKEPERVDNFEAIIVDKYLFKTFEDMANVLNKAELGFEDKSKEEMIATYHKFYSEEDEKKYSVVIFRVKVI